MTHSFPRALLQAAALGSIILLLNPAPARAAVFKDAQWQSLLDAGKTDELEKLAQTRLKQQPEDTQGLVAMALLSLDGTDEKRTDGAVSSMQQCVERLPKEAVCHYALGSAYGVQAMTGGMFKAMGLVGKIKGELSRALELDPSFFEARSALQQFYLMVPGVAGGGAEKAKSLEAEIRSSQPEHAKLLRARAAMQDKQMADAERELQSIKPGSDTSLQSELRESWVALGMYFVREKQFPKAKTWFEQLERDQPKQAMGAYGLGRLALEMGQPEDAIRQLERARAMDGADSLPIDYRLGIAFQTKGDKDKAKATLTRFVASKRASPNNIKDARKRLAELG
jgi:tetratricopeptide (TPR) repeat protein